MKITSFNPLIITKKADDIIKLFEELGFEQRHHNREYEDRIGIRMSDSNGFHVDVVQSDTAPQGMMTIRMNVDNYEEAYDFLISHGFKNSNPESLELRSSKATGMISPSGFMISLVQHKKDHK